MVERPGGPGGIFKLSLKKTVRMKRMAYDGAPKLYFCLVHCYTLSEKSQFTCPKPGCKPYKLSHTVCEHSLYYDHVSNRVIV